MGGCASWPPLSDGVLEGASVQHKCVRRQLEEEQCSSEQLEVDGSVLTIASLLGLLVKIQVVAGDALHEGSLFRRLCASRRFD